MKAFLLSLLTFSLVLIAGCNKDEAKDEASLLSFNSDTIYLTHSMKGWELYSWHNDNGWNFSVLIGTNRGKSTDEIFNNKLAVNGVDALKSLLSKMPEKEEIFWSCRNVTGSNGEILTFPDNTKIEEIKAFCKQRNLNLNIW